MLFKKSVRCSLRRFASALFGTALLSLAAHTFAFAAGQSEAEELEKHRALWQTAGVAAYEYGYNKFCECHRETPPETLVTVRDGDVVGVRHRPFGFDHDVQAEQRNLQWYWTVEGLFDLVDAALERQAEVRTAYDATLGFPTHVYIDYDTNLIGDELDVRLTRLEPLAR